MPAIYTVTDAVYGAIGNGKQATDAAITSGQAALTSASNPFVAGDVGKAITVAGAGAAGAVLVTTISAYVSAGHVTLAANASTTVTGKDARWGTEDTTAIQAAIDAANAFGAGIVYGPPGTYLTKKLHVKSGVTLCGAGPGATKLLNHGAGIDTTITVDTGAIGFGLKSLQAIGRRDLTGFTTIYIDGASYGSVSNVRVNGGEHVGLQTNGDTHDVDFSDITIENIVSQVGGTGGVGFWMFFGAHDCRIRDLTINGVDHHGFVLDPGTNTGGGADIARINASGITVRNFGKKLTNQSATSFGAQLSGAVDCNIRGLTISNGDTTGSVCVGLQLTQDQNGQIPRGTVVSDVNISDINDHGMLHQGAQRCTIDTVRMHNIGKRGQSHYAVFYYPMDDDVLGGVTAAGSLDNEISGLCVTNDAGPAWTGYNYAVRFEGTSTSPCYRNRLVNCRLGAPATAVIYAGGADNPTTGANANEVL